MEGYKAEKERRIYRSRSSTSEARKVTGQPEKAH
jgi:hypothetical protein